MIRNLIIIALLVMIFYGWNFSDVGTYIEDQQVIDKLAEMLYNILRSVKNV